MNRRNKSVLRGLKTGSTAMKRLKKDVFRGLRTG